MVVHCSGGTLRVQSYTGAVACDPDGKEIRRWEEGGDPFANWIEAVRSRNVADLCADIEVGVKSSTLCHLGHASQRVGRTLDRAALLQELKGSATLTTAAESLLAHLESNGIDTAKTPLSLGPSLVLDPAKGSFQDNERASALLSGSYREPFVLPA